MRRRGGRPGLLGTMARTAVIAGTASSVSGRVHAGQQQRAAEQQAYAEAQAARHAPPAAPPPPVAPPPPPAAPAAEDPIARIQQLAALHAQGILTAEEFAAAKARLLGL